MTWAAVKKALPQAEALVWDGCHKIYLALDAEQVEIFRGYGYGSDNDGSVLVPVTDRAEALATLHKWFAESCALRFISGVTTNHEDPNAGFQSLIGQFDRVRS